VVTSELAICGVRHPALRQFQEVLLLTGFSGATVALVLDEARPFVRKVTNSREASAALKEQALRQQKLSELVAGCASVPEVLDIGEFDGLLYFDMAFIPSRDAVHFLSHGTFDGVSDFANRLERLMERLAGSSPIGTQPLQPLKGLVADKLMQVRERTSRRCDLALAPLQEAVELLDVLVPGGGTTAAHGDLTFENILVDRSGGLWLIDTIPSPFDHYWIDWSKIFQECEGLWHAHRGRPLARGVTWWLRQRMFDAATRLSPAYASRHYVMLGLTFARILPYAKTESDFAFVEKRVAECGRAALEILQGR
jgi:hypothetical protein